ncbi:MAG: hypothetical protein ACOYOS_06110 [Syntrophales bacterium]
MTQVKSEKYYPFKRNLRFNRLFAVIFYADHFILNEKGGQPLVMRGAEKIPTIPISTGPDGKESAPRDRARSSVSSAAKTNKIVQIIRFSELTYLQWPETSVMEMPNARARRLLPVKTSLTTRHARSLGKNDGTYSDQAWRNHLE